MSRPDSPEPPGTERILRSGTTRNPRRRQRPNHDPESLKAAPRRKRSKISEDTFAPRASTEIVDGPAQVTTPAAEDGIIGEPDLSHPLTNGNNHHHGQHRRAGSVTHLHSRTGSLGGNVDIPMRNKKSIAKRASRFDGATVLAQNACYSIKLLPSTPKELRRSGLEYRGGVGAGNHALAITNNKAMVWDYTASTPGAGLRFFDIPFPSKPGEPLPLGALVSNDLSSADSGLLLISATTGKILFYESIDRAASLGLFEDHRAGVEGVLGSLFSGEMVMEIIFAEHAGFIVTLSSGRLAHLTLRDVQGKVRITSNFLRIAEPSAGGLFGSIKGLWNAGFRKDLAAVHARPTSVRGQVQVVSLTERAELFLWELDWSGRAEFKSRIDCRELLVNELKSILDAPELAGKLENIGALDFAIINKSATVAAASQEVVLASAGQSLEIFLLVRAGTPDQHEYVLVEMTLTGEDAVVVRTSPLANIHAKTDARRMPRPRLLLPKPGHTVCVVFEDAFILHAAQGVVEDTPDAQLRSSLIQPELFEEAIRLRSDKEVAILNSYSEESRGSHASFVAFVKGFGLVRLSAVDRYASQTVAKIPAKSRIEQGVFYGLLQPDNIIDFARHDTAESSLEDVEDAALTLSDEILRAETAFPNFVSPSPTSMEQHLAMKARALSALVSFVAQNYPAIPRKTLWKLLADAERVAAAQQLWVAFEEHVATTTSQGKRKATLLDELCTWFEADDKFPHRADLANEDPVRRFFIGGLHRLERLLLNVRVLLQSLRNDNTKSPESVLRLVAQANDVWLRALKTAFAFRTEHAAEYGILPGLIEDELLTDAAEYVDAPEFWTSTEKLIDATVTVTTLSREFANSLFETPELTEVAVDLVREISQCNPQLVELYCTQFRECIAWRGSRPSEKDREHARRLQTAYDLSRYEQLRKLADVGQVHAGMALAEHLRDLNTLADMVIAEDQYLSDMSLEGLQVGEQVGELEKKIHRYFERYRDEWTNLFFDKLFSGGTEGKMLLRAQVNWSKALTGYLRSGKTRAKICWINDVTAQRDFGHAGRVLAENAKEGEGHLWAKKVELSMARLALLAADEEEEERGGLRKKVKGEEEKNKPENELTLVDLQEKLYRHVQPTVLASIDREAALEQCMNAFGSHVAPYSALRRLLESSLDRLLDHVALSVEELIDLFTLMDCVNDDEVEGNLLGAEFYLALQALHAAAPSLPASRVEGLLRLIWKRCYTFDAWPELGMKAAQSDEERLEILRRTAPWSVYFLAYEDGFFAVDSASTGSSSATAAGVVIRPLPPSECVGPVDIAYRFGDDRDLLDPIMHDLALHDELFQTYLVEEGLEEIVRESARDAKAYALAEVDEAARRREEERAFEVEFVEGSTAVGDSTFLGNSTMVMGDEDVSEMSFGGPARGKGARWRVNGKVNGGMNGHHHLPVQFAPGELAGDVEGSEVDMTD